MSKTPIYVALILQNLPLIIQGTNDVISLINRQFPNNFVTIKEYITNGTPLEIINIIDDFISLYPEGNRVTVSLTTSTIKIVSEYIESIGLSIPSISFGATSPLIRTFKNVLTYAPIDKYSAMSQFLIYKDYQMEQIKILYQPNTTNDLFFTSYIDQIKIQAELLNILYNIELFESGKDNYNILPKSLIIILAETSSLTNDYITNEFLKNIPPLCYISLTDYNEEIGDIFGEIPSFVLSPYPIDYTSTSVLVYNNLTNKSTNFYTVYTLYDIFYSLIFFTETNLPLTLNNFLRINPFQSGFYPAFIASQSNLNIDINGSEFGLYMGVFTKNSIIQNDNIIFNKYNQGGTLSLPDSNSVFKIVGIVSFFNVNIFYGDEDYYKIYDGCGNLIITRFTSNITNYPLEKNTLINIGQRCNNKFYCKYSQNKYFSYLESVSDVFNNNSVVNLTMGKTPFFKVVSNE